LVVVKPFPKWYSFHFAFLIMTKKVNRSRYVTNYRCKEVVFDSKSRNWFHIDGDPVKLRGPVTISIVPQALNVFDAKQSLFTQPKEWRKKRKVTLVPSK
jgi:diacylglycerol kinase (ATP)